MKPYLWGVTSRNGKLVQVAIKMDLCAACRRDEYRVYEDGQLVRVTYHDQSPVLHKR